VGIEFFPAIGDRLGRGDTIAVVHARSGGDASRAEDAVRSALLTTNEAVDPPPLVYGWHGETDRDS
jgi:thymidine phosphorylase